MLESAAHPVTFSRGSPTSKSDLRLFLSLSTSKPKLLSKRLLVYPRVR
jgi:hypothetical protein